jgi:hypothetical protein
MAGGCERVSNARHGQFVTDDNGVALEDGGLTLQGTLGQEGVVSIGRLLQAQGTGMGFPLGMAEVTATSSPTWATTVETQENFWIPAPAGREWLVLTFFQTQSGPPEARVPITPVELVRAVPWDDTCRSQRETRWNAQGLHQNAVPRFQQLDLECFARRGPVVLQREATNLPATDRCNPAHPEHGQILTERFAEPGIIDSITPVGLSASGDIKGRHHIGWGTLGLSDAQRTARFDIAAPAGGTARFVRRIDYSLCAVAGNPNTSTATDESYGVEVEYACGRTFRFDHLSDLPSAALRRRASEAWLEGWLRTRVNGACPGTGMAPDPPTTVGAVDRMECDAPAGTPCADNNQCVGNGVCGPLKECTGAATVACTSDANCEEQCVAGRCTGVDRTCSVQADCTGSNPRRCDLTTGTCRRSTGVTCVGGAASTCGANSACVLVPRTGVCRLLDCPRSVTTYSADTPVNDLGVTVQAGQAIGVEQRRNPLEFERESRTVVPSTAGNLDFLTLNARIDLTQQGFQETTTSPRVDWVNRARYQSSLQGGYATFRTATCPLRQYESPDGTAPAFVSDYLSRIRKNLPMRSACRLIQDVDNTLAGQWWSDHSDDPSLRIAFGEDPLSNHRGVSFLDARNRMNPFSRTLRVEGTGPSACAGSSVPQFPTPSTVSTLGASIPCTPAAANNCVPVMGSEIACFDNRAPNPGSVGSEFVRVFGTSDPWHIYVQTGMGDCCSAPAPGTTASAAEAIPMWR